MDGLEPRCIQQYINQVIILKNNIRAGSSALLQIVMASLLESQTTVLCQIAKFPTKLRSSPSNLQFSRRISSFPAESRVFPPNPEFSRQIPTFPARRTRMIGPSTHILDTLATWTTPFSLFSYVYYDIHYDILCILGHMYIRVLVLCSKCVCTHDMNLDELQLKCSVNTKCNIHVM